MACRHLSCRLQHCFHPFLSLTSVIHNVGIELPRRSRGPDPSLLPAENSAGSIRITQSWCPCRLSFPSYDQLIDVPPQRCTPLDLDREDETSSHIWTAKSDEM
ncbi:unnamed protein product [Strongylus vulgaris]|uniref:Uncharacterized protein n=1 Tax=Strongylus vulgaris TaxID=40348 RepID=A0A3P7K805_STRVU|nr:unnamed protein product [Strongylus vulgaris]